MRAISWKLYVTKAHFSVSNRGVCLVGWILYLYSIAKLAHPNANAPGSPLVEMLRKDSRESWCAKERTICADMASRLLYLYRSTWRNIQFTPYRKM